MPHSLPPDIAAFPVTRWVGDLDLSIKSRAKILDQPFPEDPGCKAKPGFMTYRDYFDAVELFLETDGYAALAHSIANLYGRNIRMSHIEALDIHLLKHGRFYHPGKVVVRTPDNMFSFLVNVAVSASGIALARREFSVLKRLYPRVSPPVIPAVFHEAGISLENGREFRIFTAEWLDGFHEWHTSIRPDNGLPGIVVWNGTEKMTWLTPRQIQILYRRVAEILTDFYVPETGEQVYPWHHAAGDFILRLQGDSLDLRLITIRQYAPLWEFTGSCPDNQMFSLFLFLCNLSIRTRLDRLDGTGEYIWSDPSVVPDTIAGFIDSLARRPPLAASSDTPAADFQQYCRTLSRTEARDLCDRLVRSCNPMAPEISLVMSHIDSHSDLLWKCLRDSLPDLSKPPMPQPGDCR